MMLFIIIFAIILFLYIHLLFHWKVSNEIDIPHIITPDKDKLETVADMRQPFIFEKGIHSSLHLEGGEKHININKMKETPIKISHKGMLSAVKKESYLSEKNQRFLNEIIWDKEWQKMDVFLKPHMNWKTNHDIIYGNQGVYTDLKYSMNYRNYICVLEGSIELKLLPPCSGKTICDAGESESPINIWEPTQEDTAKVANVSTILIPLTKGSVLYIPAYWWYSIKMTDFSCALFLSYSTYMNALSQIPHTMRQLLSKIEVLK